jgi:hypothetical protein
MGMKKRFLGIPSDAAKGIFPVKLDNFGAAPSIMVTNFKEQIRF